MSAPKRKPVVAWVWLSKEPGRTGVLSFDPPLKRYRHRCLKLVEHSPRAARELRLLRAMAKAAEAQLDPRCIRLRIALAAWRRGGKCG